MHSQINATLVLAMFIQLPAAEVKKDVPGQERRHLANEAHFQNEMF